MSAAIAVPATTAVSAAAVRSIFFMVPSFPGVMRCAIVYLIPPPNAVTAAPHRGRFERSCRPQSCPNRCLISVGSRSGFLAPQYLLVQKHGISGSYLDEFGDFRTPGERLRIDWRAWTSLRRGAAGCAVAVDGPDERSLNATATRTT